METKTQIDQMTITKQLADEIATFNITRLTDLLSEDGEFNIKADNNDALKGNKTDFINWLQIKIDEYLFVNDDTEKLDYTIDQCLHCKIGNPVIIFENGTFPVRTEDLSQREKCGLMLEFKDCLICGITFCYLFLKTDNLFLFENECYRHKK